jgi:CubicO group peptidase (beta-lactamase class C family)
VVAPAFAQDAPARFDGVRKKLEALLTEHKIPGMSVGVAENGKIVWEAGFGWADRERRRRATGRTLYNIGSTSKPITATAIMLLVEQGKLDLDSPVNLYLDSATALRSSFADMGSVTIRRLLNHTSGLSRHSQMLVGSEIAGHGVPVDETIKRYGVLVKPAGETFEYSNLGYAVLSHVVSRTADGDFGGFLRRRIFLPLDMRLSSHARPRGVRDDVATAYSSDNKPIPDVLSDTPGAADIYSAVHDLLLFGMFHLGENVPTSRGILSRSSLDAMQRDSATRGASKYGLGLESLQVGKYRVLFHHGSNGYGTSVFILVPERGICISVLSNVTTPQTETVAREILMTLIPDYAEQLAAARNAARPEQPTRYLATDEYVGRWTGKVQTWKEEIPVEMWFQPDGDIHIQLKGQYRHLLNGVRFEDGYLRGSFQGSSGTPDAARHRYNLHLKLKLRCPARIDGSMTSISIGPTGNVLSSFISLDKQPS